MSVVATARRWGATHTRIRIRIFVFVFVVYVAFVGHMLVHGGWMVQLECDVVNFDCKGGVCGRRPSEGGVGGGIVGGVGCGAYVVPSAIT